MLPDIVQLFVPVSLSPSDTVLSENNHTAPGVKVRANHMNRANNTRKNIRFCIDGVPFELEPFCPRRLFQNSDKGDALCLRILIPVLLPVFLLSAGSLI